MEHLLSLVDNPHKKYPSVHVTGTKGKGSTCAFISSALQAGEYKVGLNTSPHLQRFTERIQINGQEIPMDTLISLVETIKPAVKAVPGLTSFEIITTLAMLYFAREAVDIAVFEVGMGGRVDATNVITPLVSVITPISLDHTRFLGETIAEIAAEKAGIIKPGVPVVMGLQSEEARTVITQAAFRNDAPIYEVGVAYKYMPTHRSMAENHFWVWSADQQTQMDEYLEAQDHSGWSPLKLTTTLLGNHQIENGAGAFTALKILDQSGFMLSEEAIQTGFKNTHLPARFEILQKKPTLIVDAAHNKESARRLQQALEEYFPDQIIWLIFGASRDKEAVEFLETLAPKFDHLLITRSIHPRAADPQSLSNQAQAAGFTPTVFPDIEDALLHALIYASEDDVILASGSTFIAGAARGIWEQSFSGRKEYNSEHVVQAT